MKGIKSTSRHKVNDEHRNIDRNVWTYRKGWLLPKMRSTPGTDHRKTNKNYRLTSTTSNFLRYSFCKSICVRKIHNFLTSRDTMSIKQSLNSTKCPSYCTKQYVLLVNNYNLPFLFHFVL